MIKPINDVSEIEGRPLDLIPEFCNITSHLLDVTPEIALATFKVYSDDFAKALENCDTEKLQFAEVLAKIHKLGTQHYEGSDNESNSTRKE